MLVGISHVAPKLAPKHMMYLSSAQGTPSYLSSTPTRSLHSIFFAMESIFRLSTPSKSSIDCSLQTPLSFNQSLPPNPQCLLKCHVDDLEAKKFLTFTTSSRPQVIEDFVLDYMIIGGILSHVM